MRLTLALFAVIAAACGSPEDPVTGTPDARPQPGPIGLTIVAPTAGAEFTADKLSAEGALVAKVPIKVQIEGAPAKIVITHVGKIVGMIDGRGEGEVEVTTPIAAPLIAVAYDAEQMPVASDQVDIKVKAPVVSNCRDYLRLYQVAFTEGPALRGVPDPISVNTPIGGIKYRYVEQTTPRTKITANCDLVVSLLKAAPILKARNVAEVVDIGIYNYRCIGGGTPPGCTLSQHAQANAIDIAGVTDKDGTYYNVTTDWLIDPAGERTCEAATQPGKDRFLHEMICALKAAKVWNIVLTPNYNAAHRDHFHVDLTPGSDSIRSLPTWELPIGND